MPDPVSRFDVERKLVDKASNDPAFRAALLADPKAVLEKELGIPIPAAISVTVHEESRSSIHLVLPPADKLSDDELAAVAGGYCCYSSCCPP